MHQYFLKFSTINCVAKWLTNFINKLVLLFSEMRLDLKCKEDVFAGFKLGEFKSIIVEGSRKQWEFGSYVNLGDLVFVTSPKSKSPVVREVSQFIRYAGAATLDTALEELKKEFGFAIEGREICKFYLAPNEVLGFMSYLYEGVYAITTRTFKKKFRRR